MPQEPLQVDALQVEPGSGDTLLIERDSAAGSMKFTDAVVTGALLSELGGLRTFSSVFTVSPSGIGAEYPTIQEALDAVLVTASLTAPALILVGPGVYTEDLVIEKDGVFLVGLGGVTIQSATAAPTITVQAGGSSTPLTTHLENLRIVNTNDGEECLRVIGGAGSTVGSEEILLLNCNLVATGVGTFQIRADIANNIRVQGGTWAGGSSTALTFVTQCASFIMRDVEEADAFQLSYDTGGSIPSISTSSYVFEDIGETGNILSTFTGGGSLTLANCPNLGNITHSGDQALDVTASRMGVLTLNGTTVANLLGSSYTNFLGAGTLNIWDGEKWVTPGLPLLREHYPPLQFLLPADPDWAVSVPASVGSDPVTTSLVVASFDDTANEGVGFVLTVPSNATQLTLKFKGRAGAAPGAASAVGLNLYTRLVPDNLPVLAWSAPVALTPLSIPTNANFQYDSETLTLVAAGLTAGDLYMFEVTRDTAVGSNLTGDWLLVELGVEFS